jgi:anaerobic magnesium-protoporphyrin IX monomethyl ester cyclase
MEGNEKMRITLITPTPPDVAAFGVRALSAYLKQHGKDVRVIFLPGGIEMFRDQSGFRYHYHPDILAQVVDLCRGSGLVGLSFMSNYLDRAQQLAGAVRQALPDVPIIVGGIHPTVAPESCLDLADLVCIGEGEEALLELIERIEAGRDYSDVANLCLRRNGTVIRNPLRPLIQDLDTLPLYDFGPEGHYLFDHMRKAILPATTDLLRHCFLIEPHPEGTFDDNYPHTISYKTMTTRGCPHHCAYCAEKTLSDLYQGQRYLRKRGIPHIMRELRWVRQTFPFVQSIYLFDDTFLVRSLDEIRDLGLQYKREIGLPLHVQVSPTTVTREKIAALVEAGVEFIEMGIQTASQTGMNLYRRHVSPELILEAAAILHGFRKQILPPRYHLILDNPWETVQDNLETLRIVLRLPRPFWLARSSLICFQGTALFDKARAEGRIVTEEDAWREIYVRSFSAPKGTYVNFLFLLAGFCNFPRSIVRALAGRGPVALFSRPAFAPIFRCAEPIGNLLIILSKGIRSVLRGDFTRIRRFVNRKMATR